MPSFSAVIHKPGKKFAPKAVPRRNAQRTPSQTSSAATSRAVLTPNPSEGVNVQVDSARHVSPNETRSKAPAQSLSIRHEQVLQQENGLGAPTEATASHDLIDPPPVVLTTPSATEAGSQDRGRSSGRTVTSTTESVPVFTVSTTISSHEKRTTRSNAVPLAGTKRKATETIAVSAQEDETTEEAGAARSTSTLVASKSRTPSQKKQKTTTEPGQNLASVRRTATLFAPSNGETSLPSATTTGPTRRSASVQPHDALLQNATDQAAAVSRLAEDINVNTQPARKNNRRRLNNQAAADIVAASTEEPEPSRELSKKKRSKMSLQEVAHEIIEQAMGNSMTSESSRRRRRVTPDDAGDHQIEPARVTMGELTRDSGLGKKSATEAAMQEINWDEQKARRKQEALELEQKREAEKEERRTGKKSRPEIAARQHVPQQKVVNGMIVVDDDARIIDRAGDAQRAADDENVVVITDARITKRVNQRTVGRQPGLLGKAKASWDEEMTARFYKGLRMFGTDFMMVSALFPTLERRHIKLKYVREEREHIDKIHEALENRLPVDLAEFEEETGKEMIDPRQVEEEIKADEARMRRAHEEERARENEGAHPEDPAETVLQSREQGSAEPDGEGVDLSTAAGKENRFSNVAEGIISGAMGKIKRSGTGKKGQAPASGGRKKAKDGSVAVSRRAAKAAKAAAVEGTGTVEAIGTVDEVPR